ncbi:hypothetical protein EUTSA_v10003386mg [Eutrema salsugineum]|uniref:BZIP domain-containing protein n=1 Tax=Eutrema salsugineum TaxID=72664 RepID=V4NF94_EUTSA|nr:hypothetical protein EUTSA_v10003386mg [Eutrema salsugineum]
MDSNWNFGSLGTAPLGMMNIPVSTPLNRQGSIYSWTLDQIQNNLGKDCGSMYMEELLKNICSAEETQGMVSTNGLNDGLQRQRSIILPQILSQKTIDEVWKYITEEEEHTNKVGGSTNIPQIQRQQTLGEVTLEEFLTRAGATGNNNSSGYIHEPSSSISRNRNKNLSFDKFQQEPMVSHLLNNNVARSRNYGSNFHPSLSVSMSYQPQQQQQNQFLPQQPIMSKTHGYEPQLAFTSGQINNYGLRDSFMEIGDQSHQQKNISLVPSNATIPSGTMSVDTCSRITTFPQSDGIQKIGVGSSLVSPFPYISSGGNNARGRNNNNDIAAEKTQRRKIKNRESAARSRARKQAQIMELEAEYKKLKKENQELLRRQRMLNLQGRSERKMRRTKSDIN